MLNAISTKYLEEYCQALASANAVVDVSKQFNISPPMETKLRQGILQSVGFLSMIAMLTVDQIKGQVVDVGDSGLVTGRKQNDRFYAELGQNGHTYELTETDSGAFINWQTMTQWANSGSKGEWAKLMNNAITRNFGLDILRIGFHGTSIASGDTDPSTNPLGQDVNKGWLTIVKEKAAGQVLSSAVLDPTGQAEDSYKNLDSLANDLENTTIHEVFQGDEDLVVLVGRDLVAAEQHRLLESANTPTEHKAAQSLAKTINGRKAYTPPYFPPKAMWITTLKNLQVLTQKGTQWRKSRNEEDRKRFETSYLRMEGYAVGRFEKFAAIEAVTIAAPVPVA
ncbi:phage major capsid protein, P2 family [Vibrio sp. 10N.261.55.A7]|uniref:phage major capsid protein, P2 family n=1 Tax=Vibrio sp. 10N.261.55.A7 TaxID=1880851 RepID=UPI000C817BAC|nr:phage major capsid protein, P2 family [Vibrio sp. 10N.261.55.A7]PMJ92851.1 phage major capsid protein, P2 family [Vibrio sp. 10N.261.55.A7]